MLRDLRRHVLLGQERGEAGAQAVDVHDLDYAVGARAVPLDAGLLAALVETTEKAMAPAAASGDRSTQA